MSAWTADMTQAARVARLPPGPLSDGPDQAPRGHIAGEAAVMLSRPRTAFFGTGDGHCTQVFTVHPGGRVTLRLRQDEIARWSPLAAPHLPCLGEVITRHQFRLLLAPGQGYLLDNHRWLHARTHFTGDRCYLRALGEPRTSLAGGFAISPGAALVPVTSEVA